MRWAIILLLCSCSPKDEPDEPVLSDLVVVAHERTAKPAKLLIKINTSLPISVLRKNLFLVKSPKKDQLSFAELKDGEAFTLKKGQNLQVELVSRKKPEDDYGLYWQQGETAQLIYVLKMDKPIKILHDLGKKPLVAKVGRSIFTFSFDEQVELKSDQAILLKDLSGALVPIDSITVLLDKKTVMVRLLKESLVAGQEYSFHFAPGMGTISQEIKFVVSEQKVASPPAPASMAAFEQGVEFLSQNLDVSSTELFILKGELVEFYAQAFTDRINIYGLESNLEYDFILRKEMTDQSLWQVRGQFTTQK